MICLCRGLVEKKTVEAHGGEKDSKGAQRRRRQRRRAEEKETAEARGGEGDNAECYLSSKTPSGLRRLREEELGRLRGNGEGERKSFDRIYDYDVYNDLGDPDSNTDLRRPVLGGTKQHPYPRRCRTGRTHSNSDPSFEKRSSSFYVPRDETFSDIKQSQFTMTSISSGLSAISEFFDAILIDQNLGFRSFEDIDTIYKEGFQLPSLEDNGLTFLQSTIPRLIKTANDSKNLLRFDAPETIKRDKFFWFSDEEFARETLAGVNPYSIKLVKEWPLRSKLEPQIYGPPESAITREVIEPQIIGYGTIEEAIKEKKLYMLDYHDLFIPYVSKVRKIKGTTLYGSRTLFFLTKQGTLKPLAIELTRPPMDGKPQWKQGEGEGGGDGVNVQLDGGGSSLSNPTLDAFHLDKMVFDDDLSSEHSSEENVDGNDDEDLGVGDDIIRGLDMKI
ncbi:linoleate 13S-lipoxygenase 2-1, chloroplastic [Cajanus cajan]|uniref:linoleate 13S-lipoxygenase 2-1, chloroplastic n=1 Tax=Cajanus cajan TaxID=3821 RepID=UPI00098DA762|nr:linoleate 13S-lipoxygenase 2-1, chloroplastic [Cajanus cajan]